MNNMNNQRTKIQNKKRKQKIQNSNNKQQTNKILKTRLVYLLGYG